MLRYVTHEKIEEGFQMYCSRFFLMHACACCSVRGSLSTFPLIHLQLRASLRVSVWLLRYVASLHLHSCAFGVHFLHFPSQPLQTSSRFTCEFCTIQHRLNLFPEKRVLSYNTPNAKNKCQVSSSTPWSTSKQAGPFQMTPTLQYV